MYLMDTHTLLWYLRNSQEISKKSVYYDNVLINSINLVALNEVSKLSFVDLCKRTLLEYIFGNV